VTFQPSEGISVNDPFSAEKLICAIKDITYNFKAQLQGTGSRIEFSVQRILATNNTVK